MRVTLNFSKDIVRTLQTPSDSFQIYVLRGKSFHRIGNNGGYTDEYIDIQNQDNVIRLKILKDSTRIEPESMTAHTTVDIQHNKIYENHKILGTYKTLFANEEYTLIENTFIRTPKQLFLILIPSRTINNDTTTNSNLLPGFLAFFKNGTS